LAEEAFLKRLRGRIGHVYFIKRRVGHIYPLRRLGASVGCKGEAEDQVAKNR